jgi:hypothetical protein
MMLVAKYTAGPLKLYAGYEGIRFAPPSDPQTAFTPAAKDRGTISDPAAPQAISCWPRTTIVKKSNTILG